jgi:hypothetical protein
MVPFFLRDPRDVQDAVQLIETLGDSAASAARARSDAGRDIGNVASFCRWRQIGRLIEFLEHDRFVGTLH